MLRIVFHNPEIPPNTGNAIRLAACTPAELHLVEPLGFSLEDKQLRRAGLDYHDLARVFIHPSLDACFAALDAGQAQPPRVFAFTSSATTVHSSVEYRPDDVLLFGRESDGLPEEILAHPRLRERLRIPMRAGRRSLNLSNSAAIVVYEAWRQLGYADIE
ncbi:MAG: tRNA (cytidine(34)-2'-O)-methyltransferase [Cumulibacter sp.]